MTDGLDVIIVDDDPDIREMPYITVERFYTWGDVIAFTDSDEAISYCLGREIGVAIFIINVFLKDKSGFFFLDAIEPRFTTSHSDAILITGSASDDVVDMCVASEVHYLLEKPVKPYALQLAVRAIAEKYLKFAKLILKDTAFARNISNF